MKKKMSITPFLKRSKPVPDTDPLPELYANAWQAIILHLEWPERLGMRLVCKAFHVKQPGLRLPVINQMIIAQFLPMSIPLIRSWDDDEALNSNPRHECPLTCPIHTWQGGATMPTYDHGVVVNHAWDEAVLLYTNAVHTVRIMIEALKGSFFRTLDDIEGRQGKANESVRVLGGATTVVRAARISGFLQMSRPMSWEALFNRAISRRLIYAHLDHQPEDN